LPNSSSKAWDSRSSADVDYWVQPYTILMGLKARERRKQALVMECENCI